MKREYTGVYAEEGVPAQHFDVPILEVEGAVGGDSRGVGGGLFIRKVGKSGGVVGGGKGDGGFRDYFIFCIGD